MIRSKPVTGVQIPGGAYNYKMDNKTLPELDYYYENLFTKT